MPGVRLVHTPDEVPEPDTSLSSAASFRCFAGYAGWAAGQLDSEMKQDAWLTHAASNELVFGQSPADVWKCVLLAKGPQYRLLAETPDDVSLN